MANQNRAQASRAARASALSQLDSLGSARSDFNTADMFTNAEVSISEFIERVKSNIQSADIVVTGKIEDIKMEVSDTGIQILGHKHLLFVDKGVNGSEQKLYDTPFSYKDKMPPASAFIDYIKEKNLQLRNEENYHNGNPHPNKTSPHEDIDGDEQAIKSAAYAMSRKIFKEGFKGTPIFSIEIPQLVEDLKKSISSFSKNMITSGIRGGDSGDVYKRANP